MTRRYGAEHGWSRGQKMLSLALLAGCAALTAVNVGLGIRVVCVGVSAVSLIMVAYKTMVIVAGQFSTDTIQISPRDLQSLDPADLPVYSVLIPLYREAPVVPDLLAALAELDYPRGKLDVLLLLEADDEETLAAIRQLDGRVREIGAKTVVVPPGTPKTKPRALNHGLALARGELVVVFDAEDWPERDQLKKAVIGFRRHESHESRETIGCLQAKLSFHNAHQNLLTRLAALEYIGWFDLYLPGLRATNAPIPLGGTSNHFRADILRAVGGWDAYNVTEDCDLGIRLARRKLKTYIFESITWESACHQLLPWIRQRGHWVKGYLQTILVHTREPHRTTRELGWQAMIAMVLTVGGSVFTQLISLPSVVFALISLYVMERDPFWVPPRWIWALALANAFAFAYFVLVHVLAAIQRRRWSLLPYTLMLPAYWLALGVGAARGFCHFFTNRFHWDKTPHHSAGVATLDALVTRTASRPSRSRPWHSTRRRHPVVYGVASATSVVALALASYALSRVSPRHARDFDVVVEKSWFGHTNLVVHAKYDGNRSKPAIASKLIAFVKVLDGEWYEHPIPSYKRDATGLSFDVDLAAGWEPKGHTRPWSEGCLRRVREFGVRAFAEGDEVPNVEVTRLEPEGVTPVQEPRFTVDSSAAQPIDTFQTRELRFTVSREWANPFDADQVDLWANFTTPSGSTLRIPAYYTEDYTRRVEGSFERLEPKGPFFWAIRITPTEPGTYRWWIEGRDREGYLGRSAEQKFAVTRSSRTGYVRADPRHGFVRDDGRPFYPIGINIRSPSDEAQPNYDFRVPSNEEGDLRMEAYLQRMKAAGITMGRVWLSPWFGGLEWRSDVTGYDGPGVYNLQNAWRIDHLLDTAADLGIYIELLLYPHGPYQPAFLLPWGKNIDSEWTLNPYNASNGGPVAQATEFLSNESARKGARNYLRYVAARYGSYPSLFGWTIWNEVDTVTHDIASIADWHEEMVPLLRSYDAGHHIVSTEFRGTGYPEIWELPGIDYVQASAYDITSLRDRLVRKYGSTGLVARFDDRIDTLAAFHKPAVIEEYGGGWWGGSMNLLAQNIHDGLWLGWMDGLPSAPMAWWWNLIFEKGLESYYRAFADYVAGEVPVDEAWHRTAPTVYGGSGLKARAVQSGAAAYVWVYDPDVTERVEAMPPRAEKLLSHPAPAVDSPLEPLSERYSGKSPELFPEVSGAEVGIEGLTDGTYTVEIWNTWKAGEVTRRTVVANMGVAICPLPAMTRDVALKFKRAPALANH